VVLAKSFLYFTSTRHNAQNAWDAHNVRGVITDVDTLTFDSSGGTNNDSVINWYVAECKNTEWTVEQVAIQLADTVTTNTATIASVTSAKTFILGSYMGSDDAPDGDGNEENTIDVELVGTPTSTSVKATRLTAGAGDGVIDWAGFVVELNGSENVYRGAITTSASSPDTDTVTSVTAANSWVHTSGHTGILGGGMATVTMYQARLARGRLLARPPQRRYPGHTTRQAGKRAALSPGRSSNGTRAAPLLPLEG
jgi:hypothetical protein